jgi:hypothetical protein
MPNQRASRNRIVRGHSVDYSVDQGTRNAFAESDIASPSNLIHAIRRLGDEQLRGAEFAVLSNTAPPAEPVVLKQSAAAGNAALDGYRLGIVFGVHINLFLSTFCFPSSNILPRSEQRECHCRYSLYLIER